MQKFKVIFAVFIFVVCVSIGSVSAASGLSGKVVETMNSGGYSYVQIEKDGGAVWVAVPQTSVILGETMTFASGMQMKNFKSKTLNRTFDTIYFSSGVKK